MHTKNLHNLYSSTNKVELPNLGGPEGGGGMYPGKRKNAFKVQKYV